ncbi:MAG TPA: hypothetical protein VGN73_11845 [Gemmatimonadaceae bacterium]|jgi:hypothetical protein|nr:hypothetical protein [Gemmatimonadaceae bacterium]
MFGSQILDVALGIILVFLISSLIASALREAIEAKVKARAVFLERGIRELLDGKHGTDLTKQFYEHPLIYSLFQGLYEAKKSRHSGGSLPTYIPAKNFAAAVIDITVRGTTDGPNALPLNTSRVTVQTLRERALGLANPQLARAVLIATDNTGDDLSKASKNLEDWFDSSMDRVSGWYKRRTQYWLLGIGFVMAAALNINALRIGEGLWRDKALRESLTKRAEATAQNPEHQRSLTDSVGRDKDLKNTLADLKTLNLPIGWTDTAKHEARARFSSKAGGIWFLVVALLGYSLTALAVSLGAPFWFDLLNKVIVLRSTVKPHEKSPEEGSKDRQGPKDKEALSAQVVSEQPGGLPPPTRSPFAEIITAAAALAAAAAAADDGDAHEWSAGDPDEGVV